MKINNVEIKPGGMDYILIGIAIIAITFTYIWLTAPDQSQPDAWKAECYDLSNLSSFKPYYNCTNNCTDDNWKITFSGNIVKFSYNSNFISDVWINETAPRVACGCTGSSCK